MPVAQVTVLVSDPVQSAPPLAGDGLVQERVSVMVPVPQDTEQGPESQSDRPPSTVKVH